MTEHLIPDFIPGSELELQLVQLQLHQRISDQFLDTLFSSQLVLLTAQQPTEDTVPADLSPLIIRDQQGARFLAIFTNLELATAQAEQFKPYQYGFVVGGDWVIGNLSDNLGVVINPGCNVGVQIPAKHLATVKQQLQQLLNSTATASDSDDAQSH